MILWYTLDGLYLYDGYLWSVDGFYSVDAIDGDQAVSYLGFSTASLSVCVHGHPTNFFIILAASNPSILRPSKYDLLLYTIQKENNRYLDC